MFELNVDVKVTLHTGAEVALTSTQQIAAKNYVVELVLGAPESKKVEVPKQVRAYTKRKKTSSNAAWSKAEHAEMLKLINIHKTMSEATLRARRPDDIARLHKDFYKATGRTYASVYAMYYKTINTMGLTSRLKPRPPVGGWTKLPLIAKETSYVGKFLARGDV